jgi:serine/threonine-protein kinase
VSAPASPPASKRTFAASPFGRTIRASSSRGAGGRFIARRERVKEAIPTMPDAVRSHEVVTDDAHIGRYRILRRIETNAISELVLALTEGAFGFERTVIIKRLLPHAHADPKHARSFGHEASAYARLTHPAIVRLYDFFTVDDMPAMVLEYVEGISLQTLLEGLRARGERLPRAAALYVGSRIFAALSAAHAARDPVTRQSSPVIHRDVSPGNVRIGCDGDVKLSNFGFAKLVGSAGTTTNLEAPKGTLGYMAPEQLLGAPISPRADVYAGALLVRELLTGEPAFVRGKEVYVDFLQAMASPSLAPIDAVCPDLPRAVAALLQRALEVDSAKRVVTALEVQRALNEHVAGGRAQLIEVLGPFDLVRASDAEHVDAEPHDDDRALRERANDPGSDVTMTSMVRLQARARRARVAAATFAAFAVLFAVLAARPSIRAARGSTTRVAAPAPAITIASPAPPRASPPRDPAPPTTPEAPPIATSVPATNGELQTSARPFVHRVFVDGRFVGESGAAITLPCGVHSVRIGAAGTAQSVTVPCGGVVEVAAR